ncbi:MAG: hypothetical protein M1829_000043 [Trizodia sp. TS-e1964]|nr:MAG: hypothetical protein M1829_000043 [Trizodia sp. TS-e1964]
MADLLGNADASIVPSTAHPNLNLTPEEKRVFGQLFQAADTEGIGVVTGEVAVKFFEKTRLEPRVLGEIWQIADTENRGLLTPSGFGVVLRLIGHYQAGRDPSAELASRPGPLPKFDGLTGIANAPSLQPQSSGGTPIRVPPLTPDKVAEYTALFDRSGAQNGVLPGDQAKQIFEKARLSNDILGRIWNLADTEQRGALGVTEFAIAMHLLASVKSGALRGLPTILPPGLYEAASRRPPRQQSVNSGPIVRPPEAPPVQGIPKQFNAPVPIRSSSPIGRLNYNAPPPNIPPPSNNLDWAINPADKASFDKLFASVDKNNRGYITGEDAVPFFSNSRLPEDVLAQIWDLADINSEGHLNRDEFAVAMHLIRQQRGKRDGRGSLPATLPPNLVPPSMRQLARRPAQPTAPAFDTSNYASSKSASEDLFGLDALTTPEPALGPGAGSSFTRQFETDVFGSSNKPTPPALNQPALQELPVQQPPYRNFMPSSSFGQSIMTSNTTGSSSQSGPTQSRSLQQLQQDDLLGDNDPEVSKKLTHHTTDIANLSNQVGSLSKQTQELNAKRSSTEQELNGANSQKREFEMRLSQLRSRYEQEAKDVKGLEERLTTSRNETRKLQQDSASMERAMHDLRNQHASVVQALELDQREIASLKEKMRLVNAETAQLKAQLEKLRSEARQQKGRVAIDKKQLATAEGERDKLRGEVEETSRSIQEASRGAQSAAMQSPVSVASPTASVSSQSTNPFFRRPTINDNVVSPPAFSAPAPPPPNPNTFESVFGPAFTAAQPIANPPATSFRSDSQNINNNTPSAPSGHSVRSSEGPDFPTPTTSPPSSSYHESPRATEPPPLSESRQISSNLLPFRDIPRNDSFSSSVKVSTPGSRYAGNEYGGADTPTNWVNSANETPIQEREFSKGLEKIDSLKLEGATNAHGGNTNRGVLHSPTNSTSDSQRSGRKSDEHRDSFKFASSGFGTTNAPRETIPGAFPGDVNSPIQPTATGESALSDHSKASSRPSEGFQGNRSAPDPFSASREQPRAPPATKEDFDAAFAGFGAPKSPQERQNTGDSSADSTGTGSKGEAKYTKDEFPPITEIGHDDESDSNSERGFDDNFTSTSPSQKHPSLSKNQNKSSSRPITAGANESQADIFGSRPAFTHAASTSSQPPPANAQKPPPTYDQAVPIATNADGSRRDVNQFPPEFTGLLPARQDPTASQGPPEKAFGSPMTGGQTLFGGLTASSKGAPSTAPTTFASSSPPLSNTPLSTAPSDAYQSAVSHPSGGKGPSPQAPQASHPVQSPYDNDDFEKEFGDLTDAKEADERAEEDYGVSSLHREGLDEFNPVFDSPIASKSNTMASQQSSGSTARPEDSFSDFEQNISNPTQVTVPAAKAPPQPSNNSHQDWDAIFAGLDTPSAAAPRPAGDVLPIQPVIPPKEQANTPLGGNPGGLISLPNIPNRAGGEGTSSSSTAKAPQLGRALSSGTEHDDPILKKLTGMGYPRDAALGALEKFDYNIDKAADYLVRHVAK